MIFLDKPCVMASQVVRGWLSTNTAYQSISSFHCGTSSMMCSGFPKEEPRTGQPSDQS